MQLFNFCVDAFYCRACDILHIVDFYFTDKNVTESATNSNLPRLKLLSNFERLLIRHVMKTASSQSKNPKQVPRIDIDLNDIDYNLIKVVSKNYTQPVVFNSLLINAPRQLDIDYLEELCGNRMIEVIKDGRIPQKFNQVEMITMTFKEFAQRIQRGETLYLNNISQIFENNEQLRKDLMMSKITRLFTTHRENPLAQIFIGPQGTRTDLHCAMTPNLFYNSYGQKKWVFISPQYTHLLNSNLAQSGIYGISGYSIYSDNTPEHFDVIEMSEAILQPGDVLFNPAFWWHAVSNESNYTIGVATRLFDGTVATALHSFKQNYLFSFESIFLSRPFGKIFSMNPQDTERSILNGLRKK